MSDTYNDYDPQLGISPAEADRYDARMVERGMAEPGQRHPGLGLFYGQGVRSVYTENAARHLGEMPDGSFSRPEIAAEAWSVRDARKELSIAEQMQTDEHYVISDEAVDRARDSLADAQQRLAAAERGELTSAEHDPEHDWTAKVHPATLAAYHAAVGHSEYERDGAPYIYDGEVEHLSEQLDHEIAAYDGVELDEELGLEP
ncbi:hypothetical protein Psed_6843 (plasmid) [Pseudonocardia dioxanivorans CB1190]|uniref:Uncharacterized protein n=1 Tax=Pseudonocardia dioxanivorans (strain ATCC 55486 / DSM 44775 / JCM 13855 / CB1190) TaxID=675635 RepID=F2L6M0_PSEUX|nr:hypothetical protein [Pseudonocardia dioxanivorans]AEA28914.1 hypothetical protein Psed_6843 [Pseudonocardia dioxanivorans CB1190]